MEGKTAGYWAEFEAVGRQLMAQRYIFAKTMPENPHWYTLRRESADDEAFKMVAEYIRQFGYEAWFKGYQYRQLDVNGFFYWTMGAAIARTILINRKVVVRAAAYDAIAPVYDGLFVDESSRREKEEVMDWLGDLGDKSVLDIGCGTGLLLDYRAPRQYVGIDPSRAMLEVLMEKHPGRQSDVICTPLCSFVGERYDLVVALFGAASYLTDEELDRVPLLVKPGGCFWLMFYGPGYTPRTYTGSGVDVRHRRDIPRLPGERMAWRDYIVVRGPV